VVDFIFVIIERVVSKYIRSALFGFVTKHACDRLTDGRRDGQTNIITTANTG